MWILIPQPFIASSPKADDSSPVVPAFSLVYPIVSPIINAVSRTINTVSLTNNMHVKLQRTGVKYEGNREKCRRTTGGHRRKGVKRYRNTGRALRNAGDCPKEVHGPWRRSVPRRRTVLIHRHQLYNDSRAFNGHINIPVGTDRYIAHTTRIFEQFFLLGHFITFQMNTFEVSET